MSEDHKLEAKKAFDRFLSACEGIADTTIVAMKAHQAIRDLDDLSEDFAARCPILSNALVEGVAGEIKDEIEELSTMIAIARAELDNYFGEN